MEAQTDSWTDRPSEGGTGSRRCGRCVVPGQEARHAVKKTAPVKVPGHNRVRVAFVLAAVGFGRARDEAVIVTRLISTLICLDPFSASRS